VPSSSFHIISIPKNNITIVWIIITLHTLIKH
jgi:hypothetical protein